MEKVKRLRTLAFENFKTLDKINWNYKKYLFTPKTDVKLRSNDILVKSNKTASSGEKSLAVLSWN